MPMSPEKSVDKPEGASATDIQVAEAQAGL